MKRRQLRSAVKTKFIQPCLSRWKKEYHENPEFAFKGHGNICKENARMGRFVIFVVPDEEVENRVEECLKSVGKKFRIYKIPFS